MMLLLKLKNLQMDLIVSKFKLHKECRKIMARPVRLHTGTTRGDHIGN